LPNAVTLLSLDLPRKKKPRKLSEVLSYDEVIRLINALDNIKHRIILMTTYPRNGRPNTEALCPQIYLL
jgi:integrase